MRHDSKTNHWIFTECDILHVNEVHSNHLHARIQAPYARWFILISEKATQKHECTFYVGDVLILNITNDYWLHYSNDETQTLIHIFSHEKIGENELM